MDNCNCNWSIVQTQSVDTDGLFKNWVPAAGSDPELSYHPVIWSRIGEPYSNYADAIIDRNKLKHPENYIILPHY